MSFWGERMTLYVTRFFNLSSKVVRTKDQNNNSRICQAEQNDGRVQRRPKVV